MSTSASIRKIKIPSLNSNAVPCRRKATSDPTAISHAPNDVVVEIAKMLVRKFKILPKWDNSKSNLFVELKTKSESKCMVEMFRLCKKSVRKNSSGKPKDSNEPKESTKTIFRERKKKKRHSSMKKPVPTTTEVDEEKTITEAAQRSV